MSILKSKKKTPKLWLFRAHTAKIQSPKLFFFFIFMMNSYQKENHMSSTNVKYMHRRHIESCTRKAEVLFQVT